MKTKKPTIFTFRFTFPNRYPIGSLGRNNPQERQGYFAEADSPTVAKNIVWDQLVERNALWKGEHFIHLQWDSTYRNGQCDATWGSHPKSTGRKSNHRKVRA